MKNTLTLSGLQAYKDAIDDDIAAYAKHVRSITEQQYGREILDLETDIFLDILARGGKRIRGVLVLAGYEMCGGTNKAMIIQAARAVEMMHAYILIVDDIQDRSKLRRGKATAHEMLADIHRERKLRGEAPHMGISIALNGALAGAHAAENILANMDADPQLKLNVLSIMNRTMMITAHGQTLDIMNELVDVPDQKDIDSVLEWKTALYTVINPLHVGMVLAGAGCEATDAITPFGLHAGKAFQITDDILGIYGDDQSTGKTAGDDIREGKGTILTAYALKHAAPKDRKFLRRCLGDPKLTAADFAECQRIIQESGALTHAQQLSQEHLDKAMAVLDKVKGLWSDEGTAFLRGLAITLQNRMS